MAGATAKRELPIVFDSVREKNLGQLKMLNAVIFPIKYQDKMYADVLACGVSHYAYHNDVCIGAIAARTEKQGSGKGARLYILTLGVLAPYRGMGVGGRLLQHALATCMEDPHIEEAYLHVQTNNEEGINFYKRYGFEVKETIEGYYKRLDPPDAVLLSKRLRE